MQQVRSTGSTFLPPVRRTKRRDWSRVVCRILCVFFAACGVLPVSVGLVIRTAWARSLATRETLAAARTLGIDARYQLELRLWPLSVSMSDLRVEASDGGSPFVTAKRVSARPKIFGLLAGKVMIDQVEIERPKARVVLKGGKLENLKLDLPQGPKKEGKSRPPFSVVSTSEADVDVTIDDNHIVGRDIDADVTTDDDGQGGSAFEIALRLSEAKSQVVRNVVDKQGIESRAFDEDTLCRVDARARIEEKRILVRRLSAHGAADMDPAEGTGLGCDLPKSDYRTVELALGHFAVTFPKTEGELPNLEGHVKLRAPVPLVKRLGPNTPVLEGWAAIDAELRYTPQTPLPDLSGKIEAHDIRVARFNFAKTVTSELAVRRGVITATTTKLDIADSTTEIRDVEVRPLEKGLPIKVGSIDIRNANFTQMLHDFHVHPRPFVTWDIREVHVADLKGTAEPLNLLGDLNGKTYDFAVYDRPAQDPARSRIIGVRDAALNGKLAIRPKGLEFQNMTVTTPKSVAQGVLVGIGYHEELRVEVPSARVDLGEMSPLGSIVMSGVAEPKVTISGTAGDPMLVGDASIKDFVLGDLPFGTITQGHVVSDIGKVTVDLSDVRAQKGKSTYEMSTARLDFNKPATMRLDGQLSSKSLSVRDLLAMFHLDEDPRWAQVDGNLETSARLHLALGGPEDTCHGGFLSVTASTNAHEINLLGEHFDEGHADFEYKWADRLAGIDGAEIDIRSLSLSKVKKPGRAPVGSVLGSVVVHRGGDMRGSVVVQGFPLARTDLLGPAAKLIEGSASGVARIGGKLTAFDIAADVNISPIRIMGAPLGGSDLHVRMDQKPPLDRPTGKTPCGAPIPAAFNKEAYLKDTSSQGDYKISGSLFGGQIKLTDVDITRQKAPVITGKVKLDRFDLGSVSKMLVKPDEATGKTEVELGGEISGDLDVERVPTGDLAHAKARFMPAVVRIDRGGQRFELREKKDIVLAVENDTLTIPKVTFDLATPNRLKGAVAVNGTVKKLTHGGDLGLEAELSPIDLGFLVGAVPKMTRAVGTLSGSVKVSGNPLEPVLDGRLKVRGGEFGIKGLPGGITDVEVDVEADENEARITRAVGHFLGGEVNVTAHMPLKGGQLGVAEATVTGRQLYINMIDGVRGAVDADLEVTLNPNAPSAQGRLPFVGGEVRITQFEYTRPVTLDLTGFKGGAKRTIVEAYDPSLDAVVFGLNVRSRAPLHIRNNLVDAKLAIDQRGIQVTGTNQRLGLRGELGTLPGGRFRVFANDFEVQKGTIRFDDPTKIVPHVDITGVTEYRRYSNTVTSPGAATNTTGGAGATAGTISSGGRGGGLWRITLHAYGDTEDLHVDMTSDPALSSEDIFFLLTIGLTRAEVDQVRAGSVYASAAFEAIGTVSGADRAVKQAIPVIDDFRFGSAYSPRTGRTEPQVTLGRRLTDNVRANVSTGLTEDRQLRSNVEWRLSRPLSVQTSYDNISTVSSGSVGNFGLDFRWRIEFD
jgi:translocation and assembly module TamB